MNKAFEKYCYNQVKNNSIHAAESVQICPGLIRLSNRITLLCFVLIGLKMLGRHWPGARKTATWLDSGEQSQEKKKEKRNDVVNYVFEEFVMDASSALLLPVLHPSSPSINTSTL